ncbi:hypothetical protein [Capnocytophaga sp.]|uniref:hypothetical protein n=1 Tax=Capnocytophaga sp. TaxID=44737 RepID=UPI0026DB6879|nr:hypothetical protein [Capnocytophaga sp.]MDO5104902.1 hypothetical protein [Capnocytophaga sp.]
MSLQTEIKKWGETTLKFYENLATTEKSCDLGFYTQSDLTKITKNPELVILGINPGSSGSYSDSIYKDMSVEQFLKGNKKYDERETWPFWKRLRAILAAGNVAHLLDNEEHLVYTNVIFFNTPKADQIPAIALQKCPAKTIELLKILQPKRVLCLGKNDCFKRLNIPYTELIQGQITFGKLDEIPVYGIQHPSRNYSYEQRDLVGGCLGYLFENQDKEFSKEELETKFQKEIQALAERKSKPNLQKEKVKLIVNEVHQELKKKGFQNFDNKPHRFVLTDLLQVTVVSNENGYVAIRHQDFAGGNKYGQENYLNENQFIEKLIEEHGYSKSDFWLGQKHFKEYGKIENEIIKEIINEIEDLKTEFQQVK